MKREGENICGCLAGQPQLKREAGRRLLCSVAAFQHHSILEHVKYQPNHSLCLQSED